MQKRKKVLVFPGGTEIGLEIWKSLKDCKDIMLFSAGSNVSNHALYVFKNHFIVPDVRSNNWIEVLIEIMNINEIDYVFPAHDDVIVALAQKADKFNTNIVSSPLSTCLICRSKTKTYNKFKNLLPTPKIFSKFSKIDSFPVFVKPDKGQGSQNAQRINDLDTLMLLFKKKVSPNLVVIEYLSGKEYTIDCFTDRRKGLLFCSGRERIRTRSGISMNSKPADKKTNKTFRKYADIISQKLEFHGAWFFQLKLDNSGTSKLLEVAPRIGGTMATHRVLGINFSLLSVYEKEGLDIEIMTNNYDIEIDRALVNRYKHNIKYSKIYVDLEDTLIINEKVNTQLVKFLYQSINEGCKIILISKTVNNIDNTLKKWKLSALFDEIILLKKDDLKANFIDSEGAIFIDDSFSERKSVQDRYKIPTFDCSMVELLIDESV